MSISAMPEIKGEINTLDDRLAMGLPPYHQTLKFQNIHKITQALRRYTNDELIALLETSSIPLVQRYAAGMLLGIMGDRRLSTLNPSMKLIPKSTFLMGTPIEEVEKVCQQFQSVGVKKEWILKETPAFEVGIPAFKMGVYPVTNQEYLEFLEETQFDELPSNWLFGRYPAHLSNHPVFSVSEVAAETYTRWLSQKTGRKFRLPTEIEWEYAARGTDRREYPWGNQFHESYCNTAELGLFASTPVGIFPEGASAFGLLDMAGNVEEFTSNDYWTYPNGADITDDLMISRERYKVARGGSFTRFADLARCARRHGHYHKSIYIMGFRLAESLY
jgi:toxoflavin biosynthesis protein ToxD